MATPVMAPMVGKVVSVNVKPGDKVKENDVVAVLEAMKMSVNVYSPASGVVKEVKSNSGDVVNTETAMLVLE